MPRISEETIRRVADATDIVDLVGSYFPLKRAGASYRALCPFHNEKTPSFHVTPAKQSFYCFGCHAGGNVFRFVMDYEHVPFAEAVRRLASRAGIPVIEEAGLPGEDRAQDLRRRLLAIHAEATRWFQDNLFKSPAGEAARSYLKSRGLTAEIAKSWQIGFAPDSWDALPEFLRSKKFTTSEIQQSGLVSSKEEDPSRVYARFRGRVMFPICNDYGEVIAFSGRVLEADAKAAKYVNSPETPLFSKGRVLFGLDKSKRALIDSREAIVCEGQMDTISAFEAGVRNVIAPQGTAFTPDQARLLSRFVETVVLCFDSDRAGQEATTRSLPALLECGLAVKVVRLPPGSDPDSLIRTEGPDAFRALATGAKDFFDFAIERVLESGVLSDPVKTAAATRKLGGLVLMVKDPVVREAVMGRITANLGIAPRVFLDQLKTLKTPRPEPSTASESDKPRVPRIELSAGMSMLCRLALTSEDCRAWLREQGSPAPSELESGGELLERIISHQGDFDSPGAMAVFIASLPESHQSTFAALEPVTPSDELLPLFRENWTGLTANLLRQKLDVLKARLRQPGLSKETLAGLQQQILDITKQVSDFTRPAA